MPLQAAGKALPTYSDNDVKKLAKHFGLEKNTINFQELGKSEIKAIQEGSNDGIQRIYEKQFRQYQTNLKIDWLFDNAANYNIKKSPKIDTDKLLKDLKQLDKLETYGDLNDLEQQSQKIELIYQVNDYHNYITQD